MVEAKSEFVSIAVFTEPPVALSVMMAVSSRVATTARPVLMKRERLLLHAFFINIPCRTD